MIAKSVLLKNIPSLLQKKPTPVVRTHRYLYNSSLYSAAQKVRDRACTGVYVTGLAMNTSRSKRANVCRSNYVFKTQF